MVGPEEPLVKGLVNFLNKNKIKVFGPNKYASKLEGSKAFMKKICKTNNIPLQISRFVQIKIMLIIFLKKYFSNCCKS